MPHVQAIIIFASFKFSPGFILRKNTDVLKDIKNSHKVNKI